MYIKTETKLRMTWKGKGVGKGEKEWCGRGGKTIHGNEGEAVGDMDWEVRSKLSNKIVVKTRNCTG